MLDHAPRSIWKRNMDQDRTIDLRIERAVALIDTQAITTTTELRKLAADLNLSCSRFRHLFARSIGISPVRYLKSVRLAKAKLLMQSSQLSVKQVMAAVGCSDLSHFVRDYKTTFGETPTESRRSPTQT